MDPAALAAVLQAAGQQNTVHEAEARLAVLSQQPGFGPLLAQFALDSAIPVHIRQLSAVLLKQYVRAHWDSSDESFTAPEVTELDKAAIKTLLPRGLADPNSKVRTAVAMVIASIAHWEWPEKWPGLIEDLTRALGSADLNLVRGSIRCLEMFSQGDNFSDQHLPLLVQFLLPTLLQLFNNTERFNERIRMRSVGILFACIEWLGTLKSQHKKQVHQLIDTCIAPWFPLFAQVLSQPDRADSDCGLKINVVQTVTLLLAAFPAKIIRYIPPLLIPIYQSLNACLPIYEQTVVRTNELPAAQDTDGDVLGLEALVLTLLEFVNTVIYSPKARPLFPVAQLPQFISILVGYLQLTADQVDQWAHDPEQFLKDDDEESVATTSARKVCLQVLDLMQSKFGAAYIPAITQAGFARLQQSAQMKAAGDAFWWRMREAAHLALGSAAVELTAQTIDMNSYLPVLTEDAASSLPCLRATALWCSGQFPAELIDARFAPFVQCAIETIQLANVQELPVRVFACRGLTSFLPKVPRASVAPLAAPLIQGLIGLLPSLSSEVASTVLDALIVALELSPETTAQLEPLVVTSLLALWQKHLADVMLTASIVDSFVTIAALKEAVVPLANHLLPILARNLSHPEAIPGVTEGSLQIIASLANNAPHQLAPALLSVVFLPVVQLLLRLDDHAVVLAGCQTLKAFIRAGGAALATERPDGTNSAAQLVLQVVARVLGTMSDESAVEVGPLITRIAKTLGAHLGEHLTLLFRAVLDRLVLTKLPFMQQSLVLLYAQLIHSSPGPVVAFLANTTLNLPGVNGAPPNPVNALNFLLTLWTKEQENFEGEYAIKVTLFALMKLLQLNDPAIQHAQVPGKVVVTMQERASRRSRKPVEGYQLMPLAQKVVQLLIQEYQTLLVQESENPDADEEDDDSDDAELDDSQIPQDLLNQGFAPEEDYRDFLDSLIGEAAGEFQETDPDVLEDPLYKLDLKLEIANFIKGIARTNLAALQQMASVLDPEEMQTLDTLLKS